MSKMLAGTLAFSVVLLGQAVGPFGPSPAIAGIKGSTSAINLDERGIALGGYDPVAYFVDGRPVEGVASISATYGGARYLFATAAHRRSFLAHPRRYVPEFGGFCATGAAFGEKVDVDPRTGKVVDGKLYLNNGPRALEVFDKDTPGIISKARRNWPGVRDKAL